MDTQKIIERLTNLSNDCWTQEDKELLSLTINMIMTRDKMIKYLQNEHQGRGREILDLKDKPTPAKSG